MRPFLLIAGLLLGSAAHADTCTIALAGDDAMKFDQTEVTVSAACKTITITLTHSGKLPAASMGHNVVIAASADVQAIGTAGMSAGAAANYVPANDARVIAHTPVVGGGGSSSATFAGSALTPGGDYTFFCSFPGHWAVMKGKLVVQ